VHESGIPLVVTLTEYWFMCARLNLVQSTDALCSGPETDAKCARCLMEEKRRYRLPTQVVPAVANTFWAVAHQLSFDQQGVEAVKERRMILQDALHKANLVISPSRFLIQKFSEFGYDTSRFVHIRHGLNLPTVQKGAKPSDETLRLGYLGQIKAHKGVDLLVDAVINLLDQGNKLTLDLWGPEDETPDYAAKLRALTANYPAIRWNGRYPGSQVWSILSNFDAVVVPSRWYENSPTVILEAYNIGLPVIAARLGGMAEMVEHEKSGLLFEFNDAGDLRNQIERLLNEPTLLSQITAGVPSVRTASQEVEDIFAQYKRLLKS
jgi:glycosyltransferase involved in cell wall biosynthesis